MCSGCTVPSDSKETKLGSSDQEALPSAGKNIGIVLVPCCGWKCVPAAISGGVDFLSSLGVICYDNEFSVRVIKITSRIGV